MRPVLEDGVDGRHPRAFLGFVSPRGHALPAAPGQSRCGQHKLPACRVELIGMRVTGDGHPPAAVLFC
jgi:hypothetical protein